MYNYYCREQHSLSKSHSNRDFLDALNRLKIEQQFLVDNHIKKGDMLLSKHALRIIMHFVVLEGEDTNYKKFRDRVNIVRDIVNIEIYDLPLKHKIVGYLLNKRKYLSVYCLLLLRKKWQHMNG